MERLPIAGVSVNKHPTEHEELESPHSRSNRPLQQHIFVTLPRGVTRGRCGLLPNYISTLVLYVRIRSAVNRLRWRLWSFSACRLAGYACGLVTSWLSLAACRLAGPAERRPEVVVARMRDRSASGEAVSLTPRQADWRSRAVNEATQRPQKETQPARLKVKVRKWTPRSWRRRKAVTKKDIAHDVATYGVESVVQNVVADSITGFYAGNGAQWTYIVPVRRRPGSRNSSTDWPKPYSVRPPVHQRSQSVAMANPRFFQTRD